MQFLEAELANLRALNSGQPFDAVTSYSANSGSHENDGLGATHLQFLPPDARVLDDEVRCACINMTNGDYYCMAYDTQARFGFHCSQALGGTTKLLTFLPSTQTRLAIRSECVTSSLVDISLRLHIFRNEQPYMSSPPCCFFCRGQFCGTVVPFVYRPIPWTNTA